MSNYIRDQLIEDHAARLFMAVGFMAIAALPFGGRPPAGARPLDSGRARMHHRSMNELAARRNAR